MFPDIKINPDGPVASTPKKAFASVGLILDPTTPLEAQKRFERILQCYADFNHYTPTSKVYKELALDEQRGNTTASCKSVVIICIAM